MSCTFNGHHLLPWPHDLLDVFNTPRARPSETRCPSRWAAGELRRCSEHPEAAVALVVGSDAGPWPQLAAGQRGKQVSAAGRRQRMRTWKLCGGLRRRGSWFELDRDQSSPQGSNRLVGTVDGLEMAELAAGPWRKRQICGTLAHWTVVFERLTGVGRSSSKSPAVGLDHVGRPG